MARISWEASSGRQAERVVFHLRPCDMDVAREQADQLAAFLRGRSLRTGATLAFGQISILTKSCSPEDSHIGDDTEVTVLPQSGGIPCARCAAELPYEGSCLACPIRRKPIYALSVLLLAALVLGFTKSTQPAVVSNATPQPVSTGKPHPNVSSVRQVDPGAARTPLTPAALATPSTGESPGGTGLKELTEADESINRETGLIAAELRDAKTDAAQAKERWSRLLTQAKANTRACFQRQVDDDDAYGQSVLALLSLQETRIENLIKAAQVESTQGLPAARPKWEAQVKDYQRYIEKRAEVERLAEMASYPIDAQAGDSVKVPFTTAPNTTIPAASSSAR